MLHTLKHFIESSNTRVSEDVVIGVRSHLYSLKFLFESFSQMQSRNI